MYIVSQGGLRLVYTSTYLQYREVYMYTKFVELLECFVNISMIKLTTVPHPTASLVNYCKLHSTPVLRAKGSDIPYIQ